VSCERSEREAGREGKREKHLNNWTNPNGSSKITRCILERKVGGTILANLKSAIKRNRQNKKRRLRNRVYRGEARTFIRDARTAMLAEDLDEARETTLKAVKALDKAAEKGVIHKNNASRRKSRLMKQLAALENQAA